MAVYRGKSVSFWTTGCLRYPILEGALARCRGRRSNKIHIPHQMPTQRHHDDDHRDDYHRDDDHRDDDHGGGGGGGDDDDDDAMAEFAAGVSQSWSRSLNTELLLQSYIVLAALLVVVGGGTSPASP